MTQRDRFRGAAVTLIGSEQAGSMTFLARCLSVAGLPEKLLPAQRCDELALWYRQNKLLRLGGPRPGDLLFLGDALDDTVERAGVVDYLGNGKVYGVECAGGKVKRSEYLLTDGALMGFAAPLFEDDVEAAEAEPELIRIKLPDSGRLVEAIGFLRGGVPFIALPCVEQLAPVSVGWDETEHLHTVTPNWR